MFGSQAATLRALAEDPAVIKASGISEERTLINDMLRSMIESPDALDGFNALDTAEHILSCINREVHRREFDGK